MEKLIPLSKMSKKARKAYNESKRGSWNGLNPITRTNAKSKGYNRAFEKQSAGRAVRDSEYGSHQSGGRSYLTA